MYQQPIRKKIVLPKDVEIKKVHVFLLNEDINEIADIKKNIITLKHKQGIVIHYQYGFIFISVINNNSTSLKILYRDSKWTTVKTFITRSQYEVINFVLNFLRGDYESFIEI